MGGGDLLGQLDPERDYGDRTFAEIQGLVRPGALRLLPGDSLPVIQETATGRRVKGTGRPVQALPMNTVQELGVALKRERGQAREWFAACMEGHWTYEGSAVPRDQLLAATLQGITTRSQGWAASAKFLGEEYLGKPTETRPAQDRTLAVLFQRRATGTSALFEEVEYEIADEATHRPVAAEAASLPRPLACIPSPQ